MTTVPPRLPPARYLLQARDLADARFDEPLDVGDMAREAGLSRAHFSAEFRRAFGESPHVYLLTRRLERAAALLRTTDHSVAEICMSVGLSSVGSFTTCFRRVFGMSPLTYRAAFPPAADLALIPACVSAPLDARRTERFEKTTRRSAHSIGAVDVPPRHRRSVPMIKISSAQLWVHDQEEALAFYTKKVGMEVRSDVTIPELGNFRWLAVSPAG